MAMMLDDGDAADVEAGGSTAGEAGIRQAYRLARKSQ